MAMATGLHKAQEALKTCAAHEDKELLCFCKMCNKFICSTCAKTSHSGHDWDLIASIAKEHRKETLMLCQKLKKENLPKCRKSLNVIEKSMAKFRNKDIKTLGERRTAIIDVVNHIIDEQKRIRDDMQKNIKAKMDRKRNELEQKLYYLEKITMSLDINIASYNDFDLLQIEQEMLNALAEAEAFDVKGAIPMVMFSPGEIKEELIREMIGSIWETGSDDDVSIASVSAVKLFTEFHDGIRTIAPISETQAWIGDNEELEIKLLSLQSKNTERRSLQRSDFGVLRNGDFIVTNYDDQVIKCVTPDGKVSTIVSTKPRHPTNISKTVTDDILVTLKDDGDNYKLHRSSRRLVQRMSRTGKILRNYEFQEDGSARLFTSAGKTTENDNSDICVINSFSDHNGELIVLHRDGRVRATYCGQEAFSFDPTDVACDSKRRIIVSDLRNKSLHLLSPNGIFIRYLLSDIFDNPLTISLYQGSMWIGFDKGAVQVYKYSE